MVKKREVTQGKGDIVRSMGQTCVPYIPAQPDSGEVTPAQLADNTVAIIEQVAKLDRVITT